MKQCHDSFGDYKFSLRANETLGEKTAMFLLSLPDFIINACNSVVISAKEKMIYDREGALFPLSAVKIYQV